MADIFDFYVYDNRSIRFVLAEPIMMEDKNVTQFRFRIPKSLNGFDMSSWAWWFVYVNSNGEKYSSPLILTDDEDDPEIFSTATYTIGYGISGKSGKISFALEVINADSVTGEIINEWHTKTYYTSVEATLQGNQAEYSEDESDIISALIQQVQTLISDGGIDATGVNEGYVPTADGSDGWSWQAQQGGGGGGSVSPYTGSPSALGTASAGAINQYSRGDHVHPMPTAVQVGALPSNTFIPSSASDVGAIPAPSSPATGAFLVWNGSAWVAQTLSTWQGGSY